MVKGLFQLLHLVSVVGSKPINSWRSCKVSSKRNIGIQERARGNELGKQRLIRVPMVLTGVSLKRDQSARQCVFSSRFPLKRARSSLHPRLWHLPSFPGASLVAHTVKNLPVIQETGVRSPGQECLPSRGSSQLPRIELLSLTSPALASGFFTTSATREVFENYLPL